MFMTFLRCSFESGYLKLESQLRATYFQLRQLLFIECPLTQWLVVSTFYRLSREDLPVNFRFLGLDD